MHHLERPRTFNYISRVAVALILIGRETSAANSSVADAQVRVGQVPDFHRGCCRIPLSYGSELGVTAKSVHRVEMPFNSLE
jgi:hypothetical protein